MAINRNSFIAGGALPRLKDPRKEALEGVEMGVEDRLIAMGTVLPISPAPVANYVTWKRSGDLLFLSGQGPMEADGALKRGKVGAEISAAGAYGDARLAAIRLLAVARGAVGSLDRISQVVKLLGMVNAAKDSQDHPSVINGASDFFVEVFGDAGRHARSAVGMGSLPGNMTVEIEAILEVKRL